MKLRVCLVCLKTFDSFDGDDHDRASDEDGVEGVPLLKRFLKFAETYLDLSSLVTQQLLLSGSGKEAFCEKCELAVINPICQVYLELLSAQLKLSSELEQLGKLLDNSKVSGSDKLRVLNINALRDQLGIHSVSQIEGFRTSLAQKCVLKRKQALPKVTLTSGFGEGQTCKTENDESFFHVEKVWVDPFSFESADGNSLDLEQDRVRQSLAGQTSGRTPIGTIIKLETFHVQQDSNAALIFEKENDEDVKEEYSPFSTQSEPEVIPVAQNAVRRSNGVYYNGRRCPKCSKVLTGEKQYETHYRYHHLPTSCSTCGKSFDSKKSLYIHFSCVHQKQGTYRCKKCSRVYNNAYRLSAHIRRIHPRHEQRHQCPHCDTTFKLKYDVKQHITAIHNPGSYPCPHCPDSKVFTNAKYLSSHIRQKHSLSSQLRASTSVQVVN